MRAALSVLMAILLLGGCGSEGKKAVDTDIVDMAEAVGTKDDGQGTADAQIDWEAVNGGKEVCTPNCGGNECGDDGCGGNCGECTDDGDLCTPADTCQDGVCVASTEWPPDSAPKPIVMLVLDTSGSMEYAVGQEAEWALPECHDEKQGEFAYEKSRWIVVLEALTGTFNGYWCKYDNRDDDPEREDYMVPIPHVVPMGDEVDGEMQQADGLVDLYADQVKFGLMAFDSKPPTDLGPAGGFSYGLDKDGGLGNVNLGIRNQSAPWGALITPPLEDAADAMMTAGDSVQEHILASTPYSGSPVSPALDDALYFVQTDDSIKLYSPEDQSGDKFSACRTKILILVTSGQANLGEGSSGYPFSAAIAVQLAGAGIQLHVVGIDVEVGSEEWLHALAEAGGTGNALIVEDPSQLRSTLETVFLNAMEDQQ